MKVTVYCQFNHTGIGRHAQNFHRALTACAQDRFSVGNANPDDLAGVRKLIGEQKPDDAVIFFCMQHPEFLNIVQGRKILWQAFETDTLSTSWRDHLIAHYDALWMPSHWGRDVLIKHGVAAEKIRVVAEGVDAKTYQPAPVPHEGFVFLCVGKYEKRKGINELIQAFVAEFPREKYPDTVLNLKTDFYMMPQIIEELKLQTRFDGRIKILDGEKSEDEMVALYNGADAFVFPSRGEGFGLPCIEAIACGVPLIATNITGHTEYLRAMEGLFIPISCEMEPIQDFFYEHFYKDIYKGEPYGNWAKPDIASIRKGMREVYDNKDAWKEKAARASAIIRETFDWSTAAKRAVTELL